MEAGDQLGTSEGGDILKNPTAEEPQPAGTGKKGKEASAPEGGDLGLKLKEASTLGGEILKKRKEAMAALDLLFPTAKKAQPMGAALDLLLPTAKKAQPAGVGKKVVKKKVPQDVIDSIKAKPFNIVQELSDEDLADQPQEFREAYDRVWLLDEKVRSYEQALIQQHTVMGYAEDEIEVTDDEDEGTGEKVEETLEIKTGGKGV